MLTKHGQRLNQSGITVENAVKFKRLKDTVTGSYQNFTYPGYIGIPFHPGEDEYPYPLEAIGYTYDGLHPSGKMYGLWCDEALPAAKAALLAK